MGVGPVELRIGSQRHGYEYRIITTITTEQHNFYLTAEITGNKRF